MKVMKGVSGGFSPEKQKKHKQGVIDVCRSKIRLARGEVFYVMFTWSSDTY